MGRSYNVRIPVDAFIYIEKLSEIVH